MCIKSCFSTADECHAFIIGFSEGATFFRQARPMPMEYKNPLNEEWHYYAFGRPVGFIVSVVLLLAILLEVLHIGGLL